MVKAKIFEKKEKSGKTLRNISLGLIILGFFFSAIFFIYNSSQSAGQQGNNNQKINVYLITLSSFSAIIMVLLLYGHGSRGSKMLINFSIIVTLVISGVAVEKLGKGFENNFPGAAGEEEKATLNIYASLAVAFYGVSSLLCLLNKFYLG